MPIGASLIDPNTPGIVGNNMNPGGSNMAVPTAASNNTPAIGGNSNPLVPQFPGGQTTPDVSSSINSAFPANAGVGGTGDSNSANIFQLSGGQPGTQDPGKFFSNLITGFKNAGFGSAQGSLLANFLLSGAGFNPQVANAMISLMQPAINRGEADIMEQMGSRGLSSSSSATGIALGDYLSQVQLNEGAIMANLYEQSVQNYMNVLMGSKQTQHGPDLLSQVMSVLGPFWNAGGGVGA